ncbi:MAG: sulfite exporter TauE/SafE family protein, partial [Flavobacteriales bacterium]
GSRILSVGLYNLGRILVYVIIGGVFGLFGKGLALAGVQQYLSLILGFLIVVGVFVPTLSRKFKSVNSPVFKWIGQLKSSFHKQFGKKTYKSIFVLGLLNGLLPCGLVYMAVAGAIVASSIQMGMLYMFLFGIGTLPVMFALPYFGQMITLNYRAQLRKVIPVFAVVFGVLLMLRGANLGIPLVSPKISNGTMNCCHPNSD